MFDTIAFDADDTLWYNEHLYIWKRDQFIDLLRPFADADAIGHSLDETELANLRYYGYGIKSFALSMIETAITLTQGRVSGEVIEAILAFSKEMQDHPVKLLAGVETVLDQLEGTATLMLITKGDLFEQESKIARSGIADRFQCIEVVSEKTPPTYAGLLTKYDIPAQSFMMIGNSLRSDVLPVIDIGGTAVHIPAATTWAHEQVSEASPAASGYHEVVSIDQVPSLIVHLSTVLESDRPT